jgi:hypothetical protein
MIKPTATISAKDIRELKKKLNEVEPGLRGQFVKDIRIIGKEAERPIKSALRRVRPLSGMIDHYGVTSWGHGSKAPDSTTIRQKAKSGGRSLTTSLVAIRLNSAAASIVDMAGRSGAYVGQGKRRSGTTPVVRRTADGSLVAYARTTTVEAGRKFIANLNGVAGIVKKSASRIAWPAIEKDLPQFERRIDSVIEKYYREANRKFD